MPKTKRPPSYRHHKARNLAVVTINGKDHYLGKFGSPESYDKYTQLITEWKTAPLAARPDPNSAITVNELILAYFRFAEGYYVKDGQPTDEIYGIHAALRPLRQLYGKSPAQDFGPLKLKAVREAMINSDLSRKTINQQIGRIKRMFSWGVEEELLSVTIHTALKEVKGLAKGRCRARETPPVSPVSESDMKAVLPFLSDPLQAMVWFQWYTGCRPGSVCILRPCDVDRSSEVWCYYPESHKTEHRGREHRIYIGPQAQEILRPWLDRAADRYCFSPKEAAEYERRKLSKPTTQAEKSRRPRVKRRGNRYTTDSYRRAITRACQRGDVTPWSPNQLRHTRATTIRQLFGLEASQVVLGHSRADVTQIYAERDYDLGVRIMKQIG